MKFANMNTSDRLQRVAKYLADGKEHTTMDIIQNCRVCAVNSIIAELRSNSLVITCRREKHAWYYKREDV